MVDLEEIYKLEPNGLTYNKERAKQYMNFHQDYYADLSTPSLDEDEIDDIKDMVIKG